MPRFMIRSDIEGITGVVSYEQAEPEKPEYDFGRRMFMSDLMALVEGLNEGGADEIVIYDEHYYGRNIDIAQLPSNVTAICGKPPYSPGWSGGLDSSFKGLILLGFHSKSGTVGGLLNHSYELDIKDLRLNGTSVGEIGMEAAIAGDHDLPVLMITADSAGVAEAEKLLPGIAGVTVKESLSETGGLCYSASRTSDMIRRTAEQIASRIPAVKPLNFGTSVKLVIELNAGEYLCEFRRLFKNEMCKRNTIEIRGSSATEVWAKYWKMKLECQNSMKDNG